MIRMLGSCGELRHTEQPACEFNTTEAKTSNNNTRIRIKHINNFEQHCFYSASGSTSVSAQRGAMAGGQLLPLSLVRGVGVRRLVHGSGTFSVRVRG